MAEDNFFVYSNDYADLIVEYNIGNNEIIQRFEPDFIKSINYKYAVVYKSIPDIQTMPITRYGYNTFPKCYGLMDSSSVTSTNVNRIRNNPDLALEGRDVIIGFIDTGIDATNKLFINADGTSRVIAMWDQTIEDGTSIMGYGKDYLQREISENRISNDDNGHGTFLAGIAAGGEDRENDFFGMAPLADIAVVKLKEAKQYLKDYYYIPDNVPCYQENDIMAGIVYLINVAGLVRKPLVICIGVGTNSGDHNGRSYLEEYIELVSDRSGVAVVISGGNEVNRGHHFESNRQEDVEIKVGEEEKGFSLELWATYINLASIGIVSPTGEYVERIPARLNNNERINFLFDRTTIFVNYEIIEEGTGDELIFIRFETPKSGVWIIKVYYESDEESTYNMWLPIDNFISRDTYFIRTDPEITLCGPGNGLYSITTSGYNHLSDSIYINSSRGYTRYGRIKPDIAAPAVNVFGPDLRGGYTTKTGTSIAAAHTAGAVAILFEWAVTDNNFRAINGLVVKKFLIRGARRLPNVVYPNREWGYGMLDIYSSLESLRITL